MKIIKFEFIVKATDDDLHEVLDELRHWELLPELGCKGIKASLATQEEFDVHIGAETIH